MVRNKPETLWGLYYGLECCLIDLRYLTTETSKLEDVRCSLMNEMIDGIGLT